MEKIINKKEIRVVGLQRSGNHAVINWILSQETGRKCFLNYVDPKSNPFSTVKPDKLTGFSDGFSFKKEVIQPTIKDCLLYSYEDEELSNIFCEEFFKKHDQYVGKSKRIFNILIIRDPFNFFACRIQWLKDNHRTGINLDSRESTFRLIKLWKMYAKEYLGYTNYLPPKKIVVNFNFWFSCKNYRRKIANDLHIEHTDAGINKCATASTFEDKKQDAFGASELDVLNRWQPFTSDPIFKLVVQDEELISLSNKIFGEILDKK